MKNTNEYRFSCGSLYKFNKAQNAYVHVYKAKSHENKQQAIRSYESRY